jgi:hypothetical protein
MKLVIALLAAVVVCTLGVVFALFDYTRHGSVTAASTAASTAKPSSPSSALQPIVDGSTLPTPPAVVGSLAGGVVAGTGPVAVAPQAQPAAAQPPAPLEAHAPATAKPAGQQGDNKKGGHGGHGRGHGGGGGGGD